MKTSPGISADRQTFGKHRLRLLQAGCSLTLMVAWYSMEDKRGVTEARPGAMPSGSLPVARMVTFAHGKCRQRDSHMEVKAAGAVWFLPGSLAQMTEVPKKPHHRDPLKQERRHMCLPGSHHTPALNPTFILLLPPTHPLTHLPTPSSTHSSAPGPALPSPFLSSSHHCDAGHAANYSAHSTIQVTDGRGSCSEPCFEEQWNPPEDSCSKNKPFGGDHAPQSQPGCMLGMPDSHHHPYPPLPHP